MAMPAPTLDIALTFDTDADLFDASLGGERQPGWRGVAEGIPALLDLLDTLVDDDGRVARATWFVRVDDQIAAVHGDAAYLLRAHAAVFERCRARGDVLAWHPHLYCRQGDGWIQETDEDRLESQLRRCHEAFVASCGRPPASRIGEAYCSPRIMATLDDLGVPRDATAMPGRVRIDDERTVDWGPTPAEPYRPSIADHRVAGEPARQLVEIPMTMVAVRADYDAEPYLRYIDLSFHPRALGPGLESSIPTMPHLVTMTHPSGVLDDLVSGGHGLVALTISAVAANVATIVEACRRAGRPHRFVTIDELVRVSAARA